MDKMKWFREARFGMFVHWGCYAVHGRGEWAMFQEKIPVGEYDRYAREFHPKKYRPDEWVALAQAAGMKYMVLTTRHHDGYSLFDSRVSEFTSVKTAAKKDLVREFVAACRKRRMRIGFYYSLPDWRWPAFFSGPEKDPAGWRRFLAYAHEQVRELCANYGKIDLLWYDYMAPDGRKEPYTAQDWRAAELNALVRKLQPDILINNRAGLPEDFDTPEQHLAASTPGRMWESCMTMNFHWGYFPADVLWKDAKHLVHCLTGCASGEGNYLLNVGPRPDGTVPAEVKTRLRTVGAWLKRNGEAIYGSSRCPVPGGTAGVFTACGNKRYLFVHWWHGRTIALPSAEEKITSAYILSTGRKVRVERQGERLLLTDLPAKPPDPLCSVIVLEGPGSGSKPVSVDPTGCLESNGRI